MTSLQIELFLSVAKHLNFTKASVENHISQPTTSRQIALLENELGVKLFQRDKNTVKLTAGGKLIANEFEYFKKNFASLLDTVKNLKDEISGKLSIGYMSYLNTSIFVYPLIAAFLKLLPNIEIRMESATFSVLRERLTKKEYDIIFTYNFDMRLMENILYKKCYPVSHVIVMPSTHPLASKRDLPLSALSGETFLLPEPAESKGRGSDVLTICEKFDIRDINLQNSCSIEDMMFGVLMGKGIALVSSSNICFFDEKYTCIALPDIDVTTFIAAVWNSGNRNHVLSLFTDFISESPSIDVFFHK